jgi:hypothetical protein
LIPEGNSGISGRSFKLLPIPANASASNSPRFSSRLVRSFGFEDGVMAHAISCPPRAASLDDLIDLFFDIFSHLKFKNGIIGNHRQWCPKPDHIFIFDEGRILTLPKISPALPKIFLKFMKKSLFEI